MKNFTFGDYRLQITWPEFKIRSDKKGFDSHVSFQTIIRLGIHENFWVFGVSVLGFGIGIDWEKS